MISQRKTRILQAIGKFILFIYISEINKYTTGDISSK